MIAFCIINTDKHTISVEYEWRPLLNNEIAIPCPFHPSKQKLTKIFNRYRKYMCPEKVLKSILACRTGYEILGHCYDYNNNTRYINFKCKMCYESCCDFYRGSGMIKYLNRIFKL